MAHPVKARILTVDEVAGLLDVHRDTVYRYLRADRFPNAVQLTPRGRWRIPAEDVDALTHTPDHLREPTAARWDSIGPLTHTPEHLREPGT